MKFRFLTHISLGLLGALGLCISAVAHDTGVSGLWKWTSQGRDGQSRDSSVTLLQGKNHTVSGKYTSIRGDIEIEKGVVKGDKVSFETSRKTERGSFTAQYEGTIKGDTITGTRKIAFGDRNIEREWIAKRQPTNLAGDWEYEISRGDGQSFTLNLRFKVEDGKVTGELYRAEFSIPIRDAKLNGATLTFQTVFERNGQSRTSNYSGVVLGNIIKGKSTRTRDGETTSRDWTAKRK